MGRQPLDKAKPKHRKGLWSPDEDNKLRNHILHHGHGCWSSVPIKAETSNSSSSKLWISKLLFAEWFSLDHVHGGNSANSGDSIVLRNGSFDQYSDFQEAVMHGISEGPYGGEFHNGLSQNAEATEVVFNSQLKFANQMVENGIIHCIPGGNLSSSFSMSNDLMYI